MDIWNIDTEISATHYGAKVSAVKGISICKEYHGSSVAASWQLCVLGHSGVASYSKISISITHALPRGNKLKLGTVISANFS